MDLSSQVPRLIILLYSKPLRPIFGTTPNKHDGKGDEPRAKANKTTKQLWSQMFWLLPNKNSFAGLQLRNYASRIFKHTTFERVDLAVKLCSGFFFLMSIRNVMTSQSGMFETIVLC